MNLTQFTKQYKILTSFLIIIFFLTGGWFWLESTKPAFWGQWREKIYQLEPAPAALSQQGETADLQGEISGLEGSIVTLTTGKGSVKIRIGEQTKIEQLDKETSEGLKLADLKTGSLVAVHLANPQEVSEEPYLAEGVLLIPKTIPYQEEKMP